MDRSATSEYACCRGWLGNGLNASRYVRLIKKPEAVAVMCSTAFSSVVTST